MGKILIRKRPEDLCLENDDSVMMVIMISFRLENLMCNAESVVLGFKYLSDCVIR
jgi:hypothetical protein